MKLLRLFSGNLPAMFFLLGRVSFAGVHLLLVVSGILLTLLLFAEACLLLIRILTCLISNIDFGFRTLTFVFEQWRVAYFLMHTNQELHVIFMVK